MTAILLIEQFRIAGLAGNDTIGFYTDLAKTSGVLASAPNNLLPLDMSALADRSNDFVGVFDGNSGNDILIGSDGRDRLDGGIGSDTAFGFGGSDRLWGDGGGGLTVDTDTLYAGQGDDDLIGGQGKNNLYAWSFDPERALTQLGFSSGQTGSTLTATETVPTDGKLVLDVVFHLSVDELDPVLVFLPTETTSNNTDQSDLVSDLQAAVDATGLTGVTVGISSGQLTLSHASDNLLISRATFGVYVDASGNPTVADFDLNDNGQSDISEASQIGTFRTELLHEVTGLNRLLGSENDDNLYGGTAIDFMYGNGGSDEVLFTK